MPDLERDKFPPAPPAYWRDPPKHTACGHPQTALVWEQGNITILTCASSAECFAMWKEVRP